MNKVNIIVRGGGASGKSNKQIDNLLNHRRNLFQETPTQEIRKTKLPSPKATNQLPQARL